MINKGSTSLIPIDSIKIPDGRQRKGTTANSALKQSIAKIGLIHPIIITPDNELVAGECRFRAIQELIKEGHSDWVNGYIPATFSEDITEEERKVIEFEENIKRSDLSWQERSGAVLDYHERMGEREDWNVAETAGALSLSDRHVRRYLKVARGVRDDPKYFSTFATIGAADNYLTRQLSRSLDSELAQLGAAPASELVVLPAAEDIDLDDMLDPKPISPTDLIPPDLDLAATDGLMIGKTGEDLVLHQNFNQWAARPHSVKYDFIHCDFPYGVGHSESSQGGAKTKFHKSYDDSEDVFWELLDSMLMHRNNFMAQDCHIMFWLSLKHYDEVREWFKGVDHLGTLPKDREFTIWQDPLIWLKSDNVGILRDVNRGPRHGYETALFITRGDRPIVRAVADIFSCPARKHDARHLSEKPKTMLDEFFKMFVDSSTRMLDPTCGSGNALVSALDKKAKFVTGLEIDPEHHKFSVDQVSSRLRFHEKSGNDEGDE